MLREVGKRRRKARGLLERVRRDCDGRYGAVRILVALQQRRRFADAAQNALAVPDFVALFGQLRLLADAQLRRLELFDLIAENVRPDPSTCS